MTIEEKLDDAIERGEITEEEARRILREHQQEENECHCPTYVKQKSDKWEVKKIC